MPPGHWRNSAPSCVSERIRSNSSSTPHSAIQLTTILEPVIACLDASSGTVARQPTRRGIVKANATIALRDDQFSVLGSKPCCAASRDGRCAHHNNQDCCSDKSHHDALMFNFQTTATVRRTANLAADRLADCLDRTRILSVRAILPPTWGQRIRIAAEHAIFTTAWKLTLRSMSPQSSPFLLPP